MKIKKVDIRPGVSVLAVLRHLNYKAWFALGEFVDNSVESYVRHKQALHRIEGKNFKLRVAIDLDSNGPGRISIRDNAAGISEKDYARAFRAAAIPPDRSGLAEFGMGMKSAACWFAPRWIVRTKALGEAVSRTVSFDIANIVHDEIHELTIKEKSEKRDSHYTEVVLEDVFQMPLGRTIAKLKEHLTDIYRDFIRNEVLELKFNGQKLVYDSPKILKAPYYKDKSGTNRTWKKDISFDLGDGLVVHGFAALREKANTARAGFSLFRRGRVVQGSGDEGYRPAHVFGSSNSYRYQRLFGELHLQGFNVSHTKDGFRWDENEQPFLELLREHLDTEELPLLRQAENYRVRASRSQLGGIAKTAVTNTSEALQSGLPPILQKVASQQPVDTPNSEPSRSELSLAHRQFDVIFRDSRWSIGVELTNDASESQWVQVSDVSSSRHQPRKLEIRVSLAHPFMVRFAQSSVEDIEALLRVAASLGLAEVLARDAGVRHAGTVRRNVNEILRDALSEP